MGAYSSRTIREEYFTSPIQISQEALDHLSIIVEEGDTAANYYLQRNDEMWFNKYKQIKTNYDNERQGVDQETFNTLCNSLSNYLENSQLEQGELIKNQLLDCYGNSKNETLACSPIVHKFNIWLDETKRSILSKKKPEINEQM